MTLAFQGRYVLVGVRRARAGFDFSARRADEEAGSTRRRREQTKPRYPKLAEEVCVPTC